MGKREGRQGVYMLAHAMSADGFLSFSQLVLCSFGLKLEPLLLSNILAFSVNLCWSHPLDILLTAFYVPATKLSTYFTHIVLFNPHLSKFKHKS